jgi:hypothetical protein
MHTKIAAEKIKEGLEKAAEKYKVKADNESMKTACAVYRLGFLDFMLLVGLIWVIWSLMLQTKTPINKFSTNHD